MALVKNLASVLGFSRVSLGQATKFAKALRMPCRGIVCPGMGFPSHTSGYCGATESVRAHRHLEQSPLASYIRFTRDHKDMTTTQTPVPLEDKYDPKLGTHYNTSRDFPSYPAGLPVRRYGTGWHIRKICIYFFTCLLCASLLLKMNLGINFFWIIGSSSTFRLFRSYESKKVSLMHRPVIYRCASKEALQLEAWPFGVGGTLITILVAWFWEGESCNCSAVKHHVTCSKLSLTKQKIILACRPQLTPRWTSTLWLS